MKHLVYALGGIVLCIVPNLAASPIYVSSTSAFAAGGSGVGGIGYNGYNETQFGFLSSNVGYGVSGGTCASNASPCSVTLAGPTDPSGLLTSSSNSASALGTVCAGFNPVCIPSDGSSSATANLSQGKVGVYATGNSAILNGSESGGSGEAHAQIGDTLNFVVAGANANTVTQIAVTLSVTGSLFGPGSGVEAGSAEMISGLSFGSAAEQFVTLYPDPNNPNKAPSYSDSASGWVSYAFTGAQAAGGYQFSGIYQFTGASAAIPVGIGLDCAAFAGTTCDYSHTGLISLDMPNGVTYNSASGVFLSSQSSEAPEPASLAVVGFGLTMLAGAGLRRRR